jgi:resuscitation-promoting factor RpfB
MTLTCWRAAFRHVKMVPKGLLLATLIALSVLVYQQNLAKPVTLIVDGERQAISTRAVTVGQIFTEMGITLRANDRVIPSQQEKVFRKMEIIVEKAFPVFLHLDGKTQLLYTAADSVGQLLHQAGTTISSLDRVVPNLYAPPSRGGSVRVIRVATRLITEEKRLPFETVSKDEPTLPQGQRKVTEEGRPGTMQVTYEVLYVDNTEAKRTIVSEKRSEEPVHRVVLIGTKNAQPTVVASSRSGQTALVLEGMASWYGGSADGLQGARTASGEVFDKNQLTAAHRTLPFGTVARVTFLQTGKSVEVRINDRGPHVAGRIIDLSRAAAEAIGLQPHGVGLVRVEVLH